MTRRQRVKCKRCVWNNFQSCGAMFCIFPRCIIFGKAEGKSNVGKTKKSKKN